ncbi:MAG: substrate-binding domain-containing protein [Oscillospiraceae bacterium]
MFNTPEIVDGIESYCEEHGFEIVLANMRLFKRYDNNLTDTPEHMALFEKNAAQPCRQARSRAWSISATITAASPTFPRRDSIPFVYAYCTPSEQRYPSVVFDNGTPASRSAPSLVRHGHRQIGVICGPVASLNAQARLRGYQRALFEADVLYNANLTLFGDWTQESGRRCAGQLIDQGVTAIYAFNDMMASGVYLCCAERGLTVGRDIRVFGYDNLFSPRR